MKMPRYKNIKEEIQREREREKTGLPVPVGVNKPCILKVICRHHHHHQLFINHHNLCTCLQHSSVLLQHFAYM